MSWIDSRNWANRGLSTDEVRNDEMSRLKKVRGDKPWIKTVSSEEQLCREMGVTYYRIPVTDHFGPEDRDVDEFIKVVRSMPEDTWLHFHCKEGKGRTTTFMAMYDMMCNAKEVSLETIIKRQHLLGGFDLFDTNSYQPRWKREAAEKRKEFIRKSYRYCKYNDDGFKELWTSWCERQKASA